MGHHPYLNPVGFASAIKRIEAERRRDIDELRAREITKGHGYRRCTAWSTVEEMVRSTGLDKPAWIGGRASAEKWERSGSDPVFIFRATTGDAGGLSAFSLGRGGRWRRLI